MKTTRHSRRQRKRRRHGRWSPQVERLEARELLAVVTVDTNLDVVDGATSSIAALLAKPGADQKISLREAILATNNTAGQDEIRFSETVFTATDGVPDKPIVLGGTVLSITDWLIITGLGPTRTKIDANLGSGAIDFQEPRVDKVLSALVLDGLWITRANTIGVASAAYIPTDPRDPFARPLRTPNSVIVTNTKITENAGRGITGTNLTIQQSLISGNADGGIAAGWLTIDDSEISQNHTTKTDGHGAGILLASTQLGDAQSQPIIRNTLIIGNYTMGSGARGGAIYTPNTVWYSVAVYAAPPVHLVNSTLSGNYTLGAGAAGGAVNAETIVLEDVNFADNYTKGTNAPGGAINASQVEIRNSQFLGNFTYGENSPGGAVRIVGNYSRFSPANKVEGQFVASKTQFSNNHTAASGSPGGAVSVNPGTGGEFYPGRAFIQITDCKFHGNFTMGERSEGGALEAVGEIKIQLSQFSENYTRGTDSRGGAFRAGFQNEALIANSLFVQNSTDGAQSPGGAVAISDYGILPVISSSTFVGNSTSGIGSPGGAVAAYSVLVTNSTVVDNRTQGPSTQGGGLLSSRVTEIISSVVSGNRSQDVASDVVFEDIAQLKLSKSLIGTNEGTILAPAPVGQPDAKGNLIGSAAQPIDPRLRPLANNGGPTMTMAPYATSPVVNAGSNPQNLATDQRGAGFQRVVGSAADMGAVELQQGVGPTADTDFDGDVDSADLANLLAGWTGALHQFQGTQGQAQGDSDADGDVDSSDLLDMLAQWTSAVAATPLPAPSAPLRSVRVTSDVKAEKTLAVQPSAPGQGVSLLDVSHISHFNRRRKPSSHRMR